MFRLADASESSPGAEREPLILQNNKPRARAREKNGKSWETDYASKNKTLAQHLTLCAVYWVKEFPPSWKHERKHSRITSYEWFTAVELWTYLKWNSRLHDMSADKFYDFQEIHAPKQKAFCLFKSQNFKPHNCGRMPVADKCQFE